jgi:hypothetical protein
MSVSPARSRRQEWAASLQGQDLRAELVLVPAVLKEATALIVKRHYLHRGRTMAQLPYWICVGDRRLGVILFAYPRLSVPFCGYRPMNLLELARLWIDPRVRALQVVDSNGRRHASPIASCAIARALRRVRQDWQEKYPHLPDPLAVVSWADLMRHEGTVYRAANFAEVGLSGGQGHRTGPRCTGGSYKDHADYAHLKRAFLYVLRDPAGNPPGPAA